MPVFLLLLGVLTTTVGLALVASGVSFRDGTFDAEVATPGTIAAVGGLILIGLGLAIRALQRIERALVARPVPQVVRESEVAASLANATNAAEAEVRLPFPANPPSPPAQPQPVPPAAAPTTAPAADDAALEQLRAKFPTLARLDAAAAVTAAAAAGAHGPARVEGEVTDAKAAATANGASRPALHLDAQPRARARGTVLQSFWPATPRAGRFAPAQQVRAAPSPVEEPLPEASVSPTEPAAAVSVLKSGVVDGMAYTLYSDGSIEAQLPQGTMRFASIAALREHIDSTS